MMTSRAFLRVVVTMILMVLAVPGAWAADGWPMGGANPERTGWTSEEVPGQLSPAWYRPIEPYIQQSVQVIVTDGHIYLSTARGLYCLKADNGDVAWVFPTEMPLGHSPTVADGTVYVGGFDRRLYAIDAKTGKKLWSFDQAESGYHGNPLVVNGKVYVGNRDGSLYCIGAQGTAEAGKQIWKFTTGGAVNQSPAYHEGKLYIASMDLRGYCVDAEKGTQIWKTERFEYMNGFRSWWPVVWAAKNKVVFVGNTPNNRGVGRANVRPYHEQEHRALYGQPAAPPARGEQAQTQPAGGQRPQSQPARERPRGPAALGETGTASGDWPEGTPTVDMSKGIEYFQDRPWAHSVFIVEMATGKEYTFEHNGKPAYAPFMWTGTKQASQRIAPAIGPDNVLYETTHFRVSGTFGRGQVCGWTLGSQYLSTPSGRKDNAWDEPIGFCLGGDYVYWSLCCDRESGSYKRSGGSGTQWTSYNLGRLAPGYDEMWKAVGDQDNTNNRLWGAYGSHNGIYHNHTVDQNPPVPYKGKVYFHRSNCLLAFGRGGAKQKLDLAKIQPVKDAAFVAHDDTWLKKRLAEEVQKMLEAGQLRTGYFDGGQYINRPAWGDNLNDYFAMPGDTVWALCRTLPHLPADMQAKVKTYVQAWQQKFPMQTIAHIGWQGAPREWFEVPPEVSAQMDNAGPAQQSACNFYNFPPQAAYAMWKYAQVFGGADQLVGRARAIVKVQIPDDKVLNEFCYIANAYIAGHIGVLNLEKMAGQPESPEIKAQLDRLLKLRADNFSKDTPWTDISRGSHIKRMSVFRNYLFMTPELAEYLRANALPKVTEALDHVNFVAPYWFVTYYEGCLQESNIQNLADYNCVFQARAWILQQPRAELDKFLDVPAWKVGDLDYIQQLCTLLETK